jgi:SulP family sulfate permease
VPIPLTRYIPITGWLPNYRREWMRLDLIAGLTAGAVVMPKAMAMATVAGLPVELGLYTALFPMALYAILGSSRRLSMSTTATIGMLTGAALADVAAPEASGERIAAAATLTLMVAAALLLASFLKLGGIANFISDPVLTGFKIGLGLVIVIDQIPKLMDIHFAKVSFACDLVSLWQHLPEASSATLILGCVTLAGVFALERFFPQLPAPLFAVAGGVGASWLMDLKSKVATVGNMPSGLPPFSLPGLELVEQLWPAAIGIALMSFTETIAVGRAFAAPGEPRPAADQELRAIGVANLIGSMFHAMPSGGGTSQTVVNCRAGAQTQMSELVTAGLTTVVILLLAPLVGLMPQATLAAVVIASSIGLISTKELWSIRRLRAREFWWGVSAALGVVLLGTLKGIVAAVIISLVALVYETCRAPVYALGRKPGTNVFRALSPEYPEDETFPGLLLVRAEGRIFFANAQFVGDRIWGLIRETKPRVVVMDCSAIPDFEYTALRMLTDGEEKLRDAGISLWLAGLTPAALGLVRRSMLGSVLGRERMCFDVALALERYLALRTATHETAQKA